MIRKNCVICEKTEFIDNFKMISTVNIVSEDNYNDNENFNLNFIGCIDCGCVQLQNLFNPSEIYNQPLECFYGDTLKRHYELFNDFIIKNINYQENLFFEIGGSYGRLAKMIIEKYKEENIEIKYQILEFSSEQYPLIENVEYKSGNCENYIYTNINTIIMSHVFEHLYEPRKFIKKISDANIKNIFISIPDMDGLTKNKDVNNLNILHTFYLNSKFLIYIFNEYGYELKDIYNYENNSIFYYFIKTQNTIKNIEYINIELLETIKDFYEDMQKLISNININTKFFICPSGFYGKFIYYYLVSNTKNNVIGFLDSDPKKIGKRLKGTKCKIYEKSIIKNYENITILIVSEKHKNELKKELLTYNNNINFVTLT